MSPPSGQPWWLPVGGRLGAGFVAALGVTWRIEYGPGFHELDADFRAGRGCIFAFWHARLLPLAWTHRRRRIAVLISRHHDGELIAQIIERLGFVTARGSSTRGGEAGVLDMLELAAAGHLLAITPDGPRGPARAVKPGLVFLASRTGLPVVPVAAASSRARVFDSWDRFRLPLPFARVRVAYGEPIAVPRDLDEAAVEGWRRRIAGAIDSLTAAVGAAVGETL